MVIFGHVQSFPAGKTGGYPVESTWISPVESTWILGGKWNTHPRGYIHVEYTWIYPHEIHVDIWWILHWWSTWIYPHVICIDFWGLFSYTSYFKWKNIIHYPINQSIYLIYTFGIKPNWQGRWMIDQLFQSFPPFLFFAYFSLLRMIAPTSFSVVLWSLTTVSEIKHIVQYILTI